MHNKTKSKALTPFVVGVAMLLILADLFVWYQIASGAAAQSAPVAHDFFLDVGQGDSELVIFPGNIKVMTDAGPTDQVLTSLARAMPPGDTYIDLAIISHPQLDHFNGYNFILDHYHVGAFIYNGRDDDSGVREWPALKEKIAALHIPLITLGMGDKIFPDGFTSADSATTVNGNITAKSMAAPEEIDILSPNIAFAESAELNDTGFVELVKTPGFRTLLTADIGFNVEDWLVASGDDIRADVLKVPHHGSKYSSGDEFLRAVDPRVAAIEVGAKNKYGHPGAATLARLASDTAALVLRTDQNGTVEVYPDNGQLTIIKQK